MELCLYNAVLTSMSHDGRQFTYVNQLASSDTDLSKREEWFTCACCPPNVLRLLGQIGGYIWSSTVHDSQADVAVHLYVPSTLRLTVDGKPVEIVQESDWPWKGDVSFTLKGVESSRLTMRLRIPGWATTFKVSTQVPQIIHGLTTYSSILPVPRQLYTRATSCFHLSILQGTRTSPYLSPWYRGG